MTDTKPIKAWWFSRGRVLPHGDDRRIKIGRTHKVKPPIIPCKHGLHASVRPLDALKYTTGSIIWRVELSGEVIPHGDNKLAASERTYIAGGIDVTDTLRKFARLCALDVIHLWDAPEVVVTYLKTGDGRLRASAKNAAWDAAWEAARGAAWEAARTAACDAARTAAWDAARTAARTAARGAAWDKQNRRLQSMLSYAIRRGQ